MESMPKKKCSLEDKKFQIDKMSEQFQQILKSNGINHKVSEVIIKDAGLKGEGFASVTKYVTVTFENSNIQPLNLFVKFPLENSSHTDAAAELKEFEKEAIFLTDYVDAAKEICKLKGHPNFIDFYPKCYYGDVNMIVLENLVLDKGYSLTNKEKRQDLESAKFAIKTLAKHHAIGHVMISENGGPENFFKTFPHLDLEAFDKPFMIDILGGMLNNAVLSNINILEKNKVPGSQQAAEKLKEFIGKPMLVILDAIKKKKDLERTLFVLNHGDYWNNNMMFLVDSPTNKIIHHVAIDFQITRYNTPALDLTYYLFTSVQPHVRRSYLLELLTLYKDTLNKVTEDFGHPTNLTLDQIFKDFREKVGYGFLFGMMMSVGPGPGLFKDVDVSKIDIMDWPVIMDELMKKWIDENPEKGKETAEELVKLLREYEQLKI